MNFNFSQQEGVRKLGQEEMVAYIKQKFPGKAAMYDYLVNYGKKQN